MAPKRDGQLALLQILAHSSLGLFPIVESQTAALVRRVGAAIPDDNLATTVVTVANDPFENSVVQGVILHENGQPFLAGI